MAKQSPPLQGDGFVAKNAPRKDNDAKRRHCNENKGVAIPFRFFIH